jgi:hypothetical protein
MVGIGCLFPFEANAVFSGQQGYRWQARSEEFTAARSHVGPGISGRPQGFSVLKTMARRGKVCRKAF